MHTLIATGEYYDKSRCGYCNARHGSYSFGFFCCSIDTQNYQFLLERGIRRSGKFFYKPDLKHSCCPQYTIRLEVEKFKLNKDQRRTINKFNKFIIGNSESENIQNTSIFDLINKIKAAEVNKNNENSFRIVTEKATYTDEKFNLYKKYQNIIHKDELDKITEDSFTRFICESPLTYETSPSGKEYGFFHQLYYLNDNLIAFAALDILPDYISSVYFVWDPQYSNLSLGKYSACREIAMTLQNNYKYYCMGFYIPNCPKMAYKAQFQPSELLDPITNVFYPFPSYFPRFKLEKFVSIAYPDQHSEVLTPDFSNDGDIDLYSVEMPGIDSKELLNQLDIRNELTLILCRDKKLYKIKSKNLNDEDFNKISTALSNTCAVIGTKIILKFLISI